MGTYLLMFLLSFIFCFLASKSKNKKIFLFFSFLAVFFPSFIAGNRSMEIGKDISVYGYYMYYMVSNYGIGHYFSLFGFSDIGYSFLNIIVSLFSGSFNNFLFVLQFLSCLCMYKACWNLKDDVPIWLAYPLLLFTLFFRQLNLLRQGLAISVVLLANSYLLKKDKRHFFLLNIIATFIHFSAIFNFLIYFIFLHSEKQSKEKVGIVSIYFILLFIFMFFLPVLDFVLSIGFLPDKFTLDYFTRYLNINNDIDNLGTFFKLFWCLITLGISTKKVFKEKISCFNTFFHLVFIDFILWNFNLQIQYVDRLSFYFGFTYVAFYIPQLIKLFKNDVLNKIVASVIIVLLFLFFWYFRFVVQNAGQVYPYVHC